MIPKREFMQKSKELLQSFLQLFGMRRHQDVIVFSDIRWNDVFQRPQQIVTKLAKKRRILFVEKPIQFYPEDRGEAEIIYPEKNISILRPKIHTEHIKQELPFLIAKQIRNLKMHDPILWFYSPSFSEVIPFINHSIVIYDCMDGYLSTDTSVSLYTFKEKYLLSLADLVFASGKTMYEEKKNQISNLFYFPNSVDQKHFAKTFQSKTQIPDEMEKLSSPIVGYYGNIDKRIDYNFLSNIVKNMPDVTFVMIGPSENNDYKKLEGFQNIHFLGSKAYEILPSYIKKIDVMIVPFQVSEMTKYVTPAKILEFMAAGKPIVSTPIPDIEKDYKQVIRIAQDPFMFIKRIRYYLEESPLLQERRLKDYKDVLAENSWDTLVAQMEDMVNEVSTAKMQKIRRSLPSYYPIIPQFPASK